MSVDFSKNCCKTTSSSLCFGLYDEPHPAKEPAYIVESNGKKWSAEVKNIDEVEIEFYAIDHCVDFSFKNGKMMKRCDGLLKKNRMLAFVELKSSKRKWLKEGIEQLIVSIELFKQQHQSQKYELKEAYVCNNQKPYFNSGHAQKIEEFKDRSRGLILRPKYLIEL